jgi:hypothetical protein
VEKSVFPAFRAIARDREREVFDGRDDLIHQPCSIWAEHSSFGSATLQTALDNGAALKGLLDPFAVSVCGRPVKEQYNFSTLT